MADSNEVVIERMTVTPEPKAVSTDDGKVLLLPQESLQKLHDQMNEVQRLKFRVADISLAIDRAENDLRHAHSAVRAKDLALTEAVHAEAAKLGIDPKDPNCPWNFNIDTGVFTKVE